MAEGDVPNGKRTDRRSYLKKLVLGLVGAGALLSLRDVPKATAVLPPVYLGGSETTNDAGSASTGIQSSTASWQGTLYAKNSSSGPGVNGDSLSGYGVKGYSGGGIGVYGTGGSTSVMGEAQMAVSKPIVARGYAGQTANLQEWQDNAGAALSVVDKSGWLGVGVAAPARSVHLQGGNACFRMDRDINSSAFILVRTALGDFNTIWKTFYVGVDANGVNDGLFFIGDRGIDVAGPSLKRLLIDNNGNVGIGTESPQARLHVAGSTTVDGANIIMGDSNNTITSGVKGATISGGGTSGNANRVTDDYGTVGGGLQNRAGDDTGSTSDRPGATVCGGVYNTASGLDSTVAGGASNQASGSYSAVPGGINNVAVGHYSFAAGRRAKANYDGCFVWADSTNADFTAYGPNRFMVRAYGGTFIYSAADTGVRLTAGSTAWDVICDRNLKENFEAVDGRDLLERLSVIPITEWNLKAQDPSIRHIGPMAQDFYTAFGLGEDDRHISTVDMDGVALASVQALYLMVKELREENRALRARLELLEQTVKPTPIPLTS